MNEEKAYTDPNGEEWDESSIKTEIELILEHYYGFNEMSKKEVIEILQWLKGMNIDGLSLIEKTFNQQIEFYEKGKEELIRLYESI